MTDRINALVVVLEKDIRDDDIECLINAIKCFRNVLSIKKNVRDSSDYVHESRLKNKMINALYKIIDEL